MLQPSPGPGNTYSCAFTAPFTGAAGDSQTDVVTVRATNPGGIEVTDTDDAVVTLTAGADHPGGQDGHPAEPHRPRR